MTVKFLDFMIYWAIVLVPFSMSISPVPVNIFMGLLIAAFLVKKIIKREPLFVKTPVNWALLFLFIITCISIVHSINIKDTVRGGILRLLQYGFVFLIMAEEVKDKSHMRKIIFSVVCGIMLIGIDETWQVLTGKDFIRGYETIVNIGLVRATASFKDANTLGIYLSAIAPLVLGLALFYYKGPKRALFSLSGAISIAGIALTYSRPTLLAIYVVLFFYGAVKKSKILLSILIVLVLISPFIMPASVKNWAKQVEYNPLRFMCNDDRIAIFRNSINMIKAHPVIGVGANTFMKNYKLYKESPEYRGVITSDTLYAHNNFLHMAGEIGLLGLGIFIWFLYSLLRQCMKIYKRLDDGYYKIISLSLAGCLIAFLVNGLTESSLYSSRVALIFWYLAGFALAMEKFIHADR